MGAPKYRIVSSDGELDAAPRPALKQELLVLEEWDLGGGECAAFVMHELSTGEHDDFDLSDKVFDKSGNLVRIKRGSRNYEWLARTTRDGDGQRVWQTAQACEDRLKPLGKSITNKMVAAANKVNYGDDASSPGEAVEDAEGKSDGA